MNRITILTILFAIFTANEVGAQNLIKNGDFLKTVNGNEPANWQLFKAEMPKGSEIVIDKTNSTVGGQSIRMQNLTPAYIGLEQLNVKVKPNTEYIASLRVKVDIEKNPEARGIRMFLGRDGQLMRGHTQIVIKLHHDKPSWHSYSKQFNSKSNKELGILLHINHVIGTVWFDDIQLREVTPDMDQRIANDKIRKLLEAELHAIQELAEKEGVDPIIKQLKTIAENLPEKSFGESSDRRRGLPFYPEQLQLYQLFGQLLATKYPSEPLIISRTDPFTHCYHLQLNPQPAPTKIELRGLKNDVEQFVLNFTNCTSLPQEVKFKAAKDLNAIVRKVIEVESGLGKTLDDPLLLLQPEKDNEYNIEIPAGMTKQLWFEVKLPDSASNKNYEITFNSDKAKPKTFEIKINTMDISFPKKIPLKTFNYAYAYARKLTKKRIPEVSSDLEKHHINAWLNHRGMKWPEPVVIDDKLVPEKMNWDFVDQNIKDFPYRKTFLFYIMLRYITELEREVFKDWIQEIDKGFEKRGFGYDNLLITWQDEPSSRLVNEIVKGSELIKEADPKLRVYNNFHNALTKDCIKRLANAVDVIAPEYNSMTPENLKIIKDSGSELWGYRVQDRNVPPQDIREMFWTLHKLGVKGYSAWCYNYDVNSWNTPLGGSVYNMIYEGDSYDLTPTKRWEAWREGVEDFMLLDMLKKKDLQAYSEIISNYKVGVLANIRDQILDKLKEDY